MALRLPALTSTPLPSGPDALRLRLQEISRDPPKEGYLHVVHAAGDAVLFLHQGKPWCAGALEGDRFGPLPLSGFWRCLQTARAAQLHTTDLPLFLCAAVLFRKAPAAHVPAALVDGETVLNNIRALGKDAVVVVQRGDARSLCFCRGGEPAALYAALGEEFATTGPIADRIVEYVFAAGATGGVTLDLYDEIRLPPQEDSGLPLESYLTPPAGAGAAAVETPSLVVKMGARVVFRFPMTMDEAIVGRGDDVDLVLDNLSISRRHAKLTRQGRNILVSDLLSENGLVQHGVKHAEVLLQPGDEVEVGKYTLTSPRYGAAPEISDRRPAPRSQTAHQETVALGAPGPVASVEHEGKPYKLVGAAFVIGRGKMAALKITGLFVADAHVVLVRDADGWRATHANGLRAMLVNGSQAREARLKDGDVVMVAGEAIRFREGAAAAR